MPFFGAFGAAWDDAVVGRWSANPLGMLWPEMDAAFEMLGKTEAARQRCGDRCHHRCCGESSAGDSVAVCYLNGADVAEVMVRTGQAGDCPRFSRGRYQAAEAQAVAAGATISGRYRLPGYCRPR